MEYQNSVEEEQKVEKKRRKRNDKKVSTKINKTEVSPIKGQI